VNVANRAATELYVSELKGNGNGKNLHLHGQDRTQEASQCDQGEVEKPA